MPNAREERQIPHGIDPRLSATRIPAGPYSVDVKAQPIRYFLIAFVCLALPVAFIWRLMLPGPRWFAWVIGANVAAFAIWAFDKHQAKKEGWRVPEKALHTMAVLGAAPASLAAMTIFRHKTQKSFFTTFYSILLVLQLATGLLIIFPVGD